MNVITGPFSKNTKYADRTIIGQSGYVSHHEIVLDFYMRNPTWNPKYIESEVKVDYEKGILLKTNFSTIICYVISIAISIIALPF